MTATQLLERLATTMLRASLSDDEASGAKRGLGVWDLDMEEVEAREQADGGSLRLTNMPADVLGVVCSYLDHSALHAAEEASVVLYNTITRSDFWERIARNGMVLARTAQEPREHTWKSMACIRNGSCREDDGLLRSIQAFSSADRPSESPENTLEPSLCWGEMHKFHDENTLAPPPHGHPDHPQSPFALTLGERIQRKCGCSSGNSCYWSSSASSDKNAADYIDYCLDGGCLVSCVQILPYRVFWHPESPTYAPQRVYFEFFNQSKPQTEGEAPTTGSTAVKVVAPLYRSPLFPVRNEMTLQEFTLPQKVWTTKSTVLRVHLLGRHQAQTFELPEWMHTTPEDRLPKYYCCLSYVNAVGLSSSSLSVPKAVSSNARADQLRAITASASATLSEYMAACYEGLMDRRRRLSL